MTQWIRSSWLNGLLTFILIAITIMVIRWCMEPQDKEPPMLSIPYPQKETSHK